MDFYKRLQSLLTNVGLPLCRSASDSGKHV